MSSEKKKVRWVAITALLAPFFIFLILVIIMSYHMKNSDPDKATLVPNALADKPAPHVELAMLGSDGTFTTEQLKGQVTLVNFWGSWCLPCRVEHPVLMEIAKDPRFSLVGINFNDNPENAKRFLTSFGNPFKRIGSDPKGRAAIDWGVYGPPETFLVNKEGVIVYKHIGPLSMDIYNKETLPEIEKALNAK